MSSISPVKVIGTVVVQTRAFAVLFLPALRWVAMSTPHGSGPIDPVLVASVLLVAGMFFGGNFPVVQLPVMMIHVAGIETAFSRLACGVLMSRRSPQRLLSLEAINNGSYRKILGGCLQRGFWV